MKTAVILCVAGLAAAAQADIIGAAVTSDGTDLFLSETITVSPGYDGNGMLNTWDPGDMFGITRPSLHIGTPAGAPFAISDDSVVAVSNGGLPFPTDNRGIINAADAAADTRYFGAVDTVNGNNPGNTGTAVWTFDITGFTDLSISADFAAMGDFEASGDAYNFTASIDGGTPVAVYTSSVNEAINQNYTMDIGTLVTIDDPMLINGVLLNDNFQTISSAIAGTGSTLTLTFVGGGDGGDEAFAFKNLTVNGVPTPGAAALLGLAGLAAARRRRA